MINTHERAEERLRLARESFERGDIAGAFTRFNEVKASKFAHPGVDHGRALCFLKMGQPSGAIEALKEELRFWPENSAARTLLAELQPQQETAAGIGDSEFHEVHRRVRPFTMLSNERLWSLFTLARQACREDLPGDFVECGVAAGGSSALLAMVIQRYSRRERRLFACDTFEGMPAPSSDDMHAGQLASETGWGAGTCAASAEFVARAWRELGVASLITPVQGLFGHTLPLLRNRVGHIATLHMDGDWYESTMDILQNLYDVVVPGGFIQIDDFGHWEGCSKAVTEFVKRRGLRFEIRKIDFTGVWLRKP